MMLTKIQKKDIRQANILFLIFYIKPILMLLLPLFLQKRKNGFPCLYGKLPRHQPMHTTYDLYRYQRSHPDDELFLSDER